MEAGLQQSERSVRDATPTTNHNAYEYVRTKRGQWWHHTAAVKDGDGNLYGVQCTLFAFAGIGRPFVHCALTDVKRGTFERVECKRFTFGRMPLHLDSSRHFIRFTTESRTEVAIVMNGVGEQMLQYPSETSEHYGIPRLPVYGKIGNRRVEGVGCYDREVFDKLLKPGETGWNWCVLWHDDGKVEMGYVFNGEPRRQEMGISFNGYVMRKTVDGVWPKGKHSVGYKESLYEIITWDNDKTIPEMPLSGLAFVEEVGHDGTPRI